MKKHHLLGTAIILLTAALGTLAGRMIISRASIAAQSGNTAQFTYSPAGASVTVGKNIDIAIRVSPTGPYNAAAAQVYFSNTHLQYVGRTLSPAFNGDGNKSTLSSNGFGAYVDVYDNRTSGGSLTGTHTLMTLRFRALRAGKSYLNFGSSSVVNFPTTNYTVSTTNSYVTVVNPSTPPPTTPPPNPTPTPTPNPPSNPPPTPTPSPRPNPTPARPRVSATPSHPASSEPTTSGLQITDLAISEIDYRRAVITWTTSKPSISKVNYSDTQEDLYNEVLQEEPTTSHSITLEDETITAGKRYYLRATAEDENGPVTVDAEFTTKMVSVIIKVTDNNNQPLSEATVEVDDQESFTDENGEVTMELPEGEATIYASKEELSREIIQDITVPIDDSTPQRITLTLSKTVSTPKAPPVQKKAANRLLFVLPFILVAMALTGFIIWKRKKSKSFYQPYADPLEAENYTQQVIPTTPVEPQPIATEPQPIPSSNITPEAPAPEPQYIPIADPRIPHHATLPELVGRYGTKAATASEPMPVQSDLPNDIAAISPTGQPIKHHTSLKDLVTSPNTYDPANNPDPTFNDLPVSPHANSPQPSPETPTPNPADIIHI